ncbi:MAG: glycoside hydrolase family 140 protein [Phycisphaeraceae bacterium]|nr:glycoside hydrolase family 140 protein [Phycisphaeraceae bacterium]
MGPLKLSSNGRYFLDHAGVPFFWLGDTQWQLTRDLSLADVRQILRGRKQQGFSVFQVMLTGVGNGTVANRDGQKPWHNDDPATPNEGFFAHADEVIAAAAEAGMILVLGVYHQEQAQRLTAGNARAYAKWIAQRYKAAPHVIWTMYPKAKPEFIPICRELAAGLREGDGGRASGGHTSGGHLITVHPDPSPTSSSFIHDEPWLDFNMNQPCITYEKIYAITKADYDRQPVKPVVMAEGGYEGLEFNRLQTALDIRKQAYWSHLAGGHHSYGHVHAWLNPKQWQSWLDSPGARCLAIYRQILTSLPQWWNIAPDQSIFASDPGPTESMTLNAAARAGDGTWALAYLASNTTVNMHMDKVTGGNGATAWWIDPVNGQRTKIGTYANTGVQAFTMPADWQDAVLLLTA